ncbi:MAG: TIGR02757 family protein [Bacteroidetes bacterium]|nr:MAG: TIGR02757 family protein [Bacteroidota bacterium]
MLDQKYEQFNTPEFIHSDPISVPHSFSRKEDIEIAAFFSALIAWGRRDLIVRNARKLMQLMDDAPYEFVMQADEEALSRLQFFVHRTFNGVDCRALVLSLRRVYQQAGGLEAVFCQALSPADANVFPAIVAAREALVSHAAFPARTHKHLANPASGSAAKRINMFLRWMVRRDGRSVDFGIWEGIGMHQLVCPLDVHTARVGRKLGLLKRKQNDWKAAVELTESLRAFCAADPVRYDFSLFGLGVMEKFG